MRYHIPNKTVTKRPSLGDVRIQTFFAFLPKKAYREDNSVEWRWLEPVKIKKVYVSRPYYDPYDPGSERYEWKSYWLDEDVYQINE